VFNIHAKFNHKEIKMEVGQFCWNELATSNLVKAKDFYGKVFGWQFKEHDMGEMSYTTIESAGREFAGMWEIPSAEQNNISPHWMAYVLVDDVASSLNTARQNGAKVIKEVTEAGEMGQFAIIEDPTGAHLALWQQMGK
jgi:uncharacterized protein